MRAGGLDATPLFVTSLFQSAQKQRHKAQVVKANVQIVHDSHFVGARIANTLHSASKNETVSLLQLLHEHSYHKTSLDEAVE